MPATFMVKNLYKFYFMLKILECFKNLQNPEKVCTNVLQNSCF